MVAGQQRNTWFDPVYDTSDTLDEIFCDVDSNDDDISVSDMSIRQQSVMS